MPVAAEAVNILITEDNNIVMTTLKVSKIRDIEYLFLLLLIKLIKLNLIIIILLVNKNPWEYTYSFRVNFPYLYSNIS